MNRPIIVLPLLLTIAACGQQATPGDTTALEASSDAWELAMNAKDIDALADLYTEDARILPPDAPMGSGRDAVREVFGGMIEAGIGGETTILEASVNGDTGHIVGTYTLIVDGEAAGTGKYIETWERGADGQWRISNDIFNADVPPMRKKMHRQGMHGKDMTHVMITHEVEDGDRWIAAWTGPDNRRDLFRANGARGVHAFQSMDDPNLTGLVIGVEDMEALGAMLESEEGQAAAAEDGVLMDTMIMYTEVR
jgi:uncharacterized protein (TIGR02246 family)